MLEWRVWGVWRERILVDWWGKVKNGWFKYYLSIDEVFILGVMFVLVFVCFVSYFFVE